MSYWRGVSLRRREVGGFREGLSAAKAAEIAELWGLKPGVVVTALGVRYVFSAVGGVAKVGRPWIWAYRLKKNGKTYSEATRLERWEKE